MVRPTWVRLIIAPPTCVKRPLSLSLCSRCLLYIFAEPVALLFLHACREHGYVPSPLFSCVADLLSFCVGAPIVECAMMVSTPGSQEKGLVFASNRNPNFQVPIQNGGIAFISTLLGDYTPRGSGRSAYVLEPCWLTSCAALPAYLGNRSF